MYSVNLGRTVYGGMFVNDDLLASVGVDIPTTWSELVSVCEAVKAAGNECMTNGGADGWPVFVGTYGLLGALYPDQEALVEGLYTGAVKWDDADAAVVVGALPGVRPGHARGRHDRSCSTMRRRSATRPVTWRSCPPVRGRPPTWRAKRAFDWTYVPFPGSDNAADNQFLFGKYDQGWSIAANSPNVDVAKAYVAAFSDPATTRSSWT